MTALEEYEKAKLLHGFKLIVEPADAALAELQDAIDYWQEQDRVAEQRVRELQAEVERLKAWKWFARMQMSDAALREVERRWAERGGEEEK